MILFGRKLGRDLGQHWSQFISVALMAALSVLIFSGMEGGWRGIQTQLDSYATQQGLPDAWVTGIGLTEADVREFELLDGVEAAARIITIPVTRTDSGAEQDLRLSTHDDTEINEPLVVAGAAVSDDAGVWLDESYAKANGVDVGESITVARGGAETTLDVNGLILQPDKIAYTGTGLLAPEPGSYGYGIVSGNTAAAISGAQSGEQSIVTLGDPQAVRTAAPEILGERYVAFMERSSHPHVATAYERVTQIQSLSYLFSSLFLLVALLSIFTSIRRLTDIQRGEVATLKALGHTNRLIGLYFTVVGIVAVMAGCLVGLALTPLLSRYVLGTQRGSFSLPEWTPAYTLASTLLPVLLVFVCIFASWSATRPMRRTSPAEGMRPDVGRARRSVLERLQSFWQRLSYGNRWAIRDASGNRVRVVMGIVATTGCMMLLVTGFGMPDTLNRQIEQTYSKQYLYDSRLGVSPLATAQQRELIEAEAGTGQWVQQGAVRLAQDEELDQTLTVLGEGAMFRLLDEQAQRLDATEGAAITDGLSNQLGIGVGQEITLITADGARYRQTVSEVTSISEPQGILLSKQAWENMGGSFEPTSYLTQHPVGQKILDLPGVTGLLAKAEQRENAQSLVDSLSSVFNLIKVFAIILAVVVLYNLGALSFTERIRDYATLRVLGFHHGELRSLASRENIITTLIGWLAGIPAGWWFLSQYVGVFSTDRAGYLPSISTLSLLIASFITIFFALTATMLLTRRIKGIDMTSALKGVE
ncbi:ABC transporter permease [Paeniglutamicibacter sp. ORCA_105]|uniref:ABC transporter permease n=1 Tax=Paeniglutamicibacter sp. ORCA_105 TaxID=3377336 RepID=UPI003896799D